MNSNSRYVKQYKTAYNKAVRSGVSADSAHSKAQNMVSKNLKKDISGGKVESGVNAGASVNNLAQTAATQALGQMGVLDPFTGKPREGGKGGNFAGGGTGLGDMLGAGTVDHRANMAHLQGKPNNPHANESGPSGRTRTPYVKGDSPEARRLSKAQLDADAREDLGNMPEDPSAPPPSLAKNLDRLGRKGLANPNANTNANKQKANQANNKDNQAEGEDETSGFENLNANDVSREAKDIKDMFEARGGPLKDIKWALIGFMASLRGKHKVRRTDAHASLRGESDQVDIPENDYSDTFTDKIALWAHGQYRAIKRLFKK